MLGTALGLSQEAVWCQIATLSWANGSGTGQPWDLGQSHSVPSSQEQAAGSSVSRFHPPPALSPGAAPDLRPEIHLFKLVHSWGWGSFSYPKLHALDMCSQGWGRSLIPNCTMGGILSPAFRKSLPAVRLTVPRELEKLGERSASAPSCMPT